MKIQQLFENNLVDDQNHLIMQVPAFGGIPNVVITDIPAISRAQFIELCQKSGIEEELYMGSDQAGDGGYGGPYSPLISMITHEELEQDKQEQYNPRDKEDFRFHRRQATWKQFVNQVHQTFQDNDFQE